MREAGPVFARLIPTRDTRSDDVSHLAPAGRTGPPPGRQAYLECRNLQNLPDWMQGGRIERLADSPREVEGPEVGDRRGRSVRVVNWRDGLTVMGARSTLHLPWPMLVGCSRDVLSASLPTSALRSFLSRKRGRDA